MSSIRTEARPVTVRARARAVARRLGVWAHLYQCARCGGWTESPVCPVCPPQ
ncbi:hypothetical protein [Streptomyces sp. NPDC102437]|uniref:hypothetical protein n=1 Tax=Streptomyces sp. NPDC102437 TaxID=3366175 RepID=UPI003800093E